MTIDGRLSLLYGVHRIAYLADELVERSLEGHELSGTEFALYSFLVVRGPATVSDVASGMAASMPATSKLLARVEERGHLVRTPNPADGRSTLVELNEAGRAAHTEAKPAFGAALRGVETELGGAADDVRWAIGRLDDALGASIGAKSLAEPMSLPPQRSLAYDGAPLTTTEEAQARRFIDWLRWQRETS